MLSGTWCSIQIHKVLQLGYRMIQMVEVWIFSQKPSTLFRGYIDTFLKIKQEASGWPDWCDAEEKKQLSTFQTIKQKRVSRWTMTTSKRTLGYGP